jgi:hypothetical protein
MNFPFRGSVLKRQSMSSGRMRRPGAAPLVALSLVLAACRDDPLTAPPVEELTQVANVAPQTQRTPKGDLVTGDAAAFAQALKEIGPDGEVLVWLKETTTPRPSAEFLINLPGSAAETIALATEAPGVARRNHLGPGSVRGASVDAVVRALAKAGVLSVERMEALPLMVVKLPENVRLGALNALLRHPNVDYVSAVRARPVQFHAAPVGSNPIDAKHTVHRIPEVWDLTRGSGGKIGVMDSGLARSAATGAFHDDGRWLGSYGILAYGFVDDECGTSTANAGNCPPWDDHGHGTAMTSLAGENDNNMGWVGMAPFATTYSMKIAWNTYVHGDCGSFGGENVWCIEDDDFVRAINWAAARRLHVLSMSFSESGSGDIYRALSTARNTYGVFLVAATGNTVGGSAQQPASYDVVMGIAGVDAAGNNLYSTAARDVSGYAGGNTMAATCYRYSYCDAGSPGIYGGTGGTSAATANVAGIIGLIRAYHPYETPSQIWERLVNTAQGPNRVVDAYAAITYRRPLSASISGPSYLGAYEYGTWSAVAMNGTAPYSYAWYRDGAYVGSDATYSDYSYGYDFQLQVVVTDATGAAATGSLYVSAYTGGGGGGGGCPDCQIP